MVAASTFSYSPSFALSTGRSFLSAASSEKRHSLSDAGETAHARSLSIRAAEADSSSRKPREGMDALPPGSIPETAYRRAGEGREEKE